MSAVRKGAPYKRVPKHVREIGSVLQYDERGRARVDAVFEHTGLLVPYNFLQLVDKVVGYMAPRRHEIVMDEFIRAMQSNAKTRAIWFFGLSVALSFDSSFDLCEALCSWFVIWADSCAPALS
jgi:hypothetical protein